MTDTETVSDARTGIVRSVERAFLLLEILASNGGTLTLSQLAAHAKMPLPTIHRLLRTLVELGYLRQETTRQYTLGARLLFLADQAPAMLSAVVQPHLATLVEQVGETANLAMLDGSKVVYVAQVPSRHSMRMFTEVGRRVDLHCTAVGKVLAAEMADAKLRDLLVNEGMPRHTEHTIDDPDEFIARVHQARAEGYALDDGEQELGVRCVAVALPPGGRPLAVSVSGPATRMSDGAIQEALPFLRAAVDAISEQIRQ